MPARRAVLRALLLAAGPVVVGPDPARSQDPFVVSFGAAYTWDGMAVVAGGRDRGAVGLGNLDLVLDVDRLSGGERESTRAFLYVLGNHGASPSALVGDAQTVSNIDAPEALRIYELWVERSLLRRRLSVLVGLYDLNSEFDAIGVAGLFLNSSFGIGAEFGASGVNGPSIFPVAALGMRLKARAGSRSYAQAVALDGVPGDPAEPASSAVRLSRSDGALLAVEVGRFVLGEGPEPAGPGEIGRDHEPEGARGRLAVGAWVYTRRFEGVDPASEGTVRPRPGLYALGELRLTRERDDPGQGLDGFVRGGVADGRVNRFAGYTGAGIRYRGLLPGRGADEAGLAVAAAHDGSGYEALVRSEGGRVEGPEVALELTYRLESGSGWALQPDLQVVFRPDGDPTLPTAVLLGIRASVGF